jgi:hypothetical protein
MTKDYTVQGRHVLAKKNFLLVMYELRDNKDKKGNLHIFKKKKIGSGTKTFQTFINTFFSRRVYIAQLCPPVGSLANKIKRKKYKTNDTSIFYLLSHIEHKKTGTHLTRRADR